MYYGTLAGLIESLMGAKQAGNLARRLRVLTHPALLVVDEIGYLPVNQDGAILFFQLVNARHERASRTQHDCHPSVLPENMQSSIVESEQFSIDIDNLTGGGGRVPRR